MIISELLVTRRVTVVWLFDRNLLEHGICEHEDASVVFNQIFQFLKFWDKFLRILLDVINLFTDPFFVNTVVGWEPSSCSVMEILIEHFEKPE